MHPLWRGILDLLYPPRCEVCGRLRRAAICEECQEQIVPVQPPMCRICGEPFDPKAEGGPLCARCRRGRHPPFSVARTAAYYEGPVVEAVRRFKYHCQMALGRPLGRVMVEALSDGAAEGLEPGGVDVVCPVPLHESRLRERGFNQSELLAEAVAGAIGKPVRRLLTKTRPTLPQVDLPAESRARNVHDAFAADLREVIEGRVVLLVDDLYTTGATLRECARVLKRAGAEEVRVFTLARPAPRWRVGVAEGPVDG